MDVNAYSAEIQKLIQDIQDSRGKDPQITINCCRELEQYGLSLNDNALIGFARFSLGETYYLMNDTANFYREMVLCLEPLKQIKEWGYLTMANNMLGIMSLNRGNAPFAMDYYMQAVRYCQEYRLPDLEWVVHMNMGNLYLNIGNPDNALVHFESGYQYINHHKKAENYISTRTAACIGLAAKKAGVPLPEGELLSEVQKEFTARPEVPEEYKRLLASYPSPDHRSDWRRLMLAGYEYQG